MDDPRHSPGAAGIGLPCCGESLAVTFVGGVSDGECINQALSLPLPYLLKVSSMEVFVFVTATRIATSMLKPTSFAAATRRIGQEKA